MEERYHQLILKKLIKGLSTQEQIELDKLASDLDHELELQNHFSDAWNSIKESENENLKKARLKKRVLDHIQSNKQIIPLPEKTNAIKAKKLIYVPIIKIAASLLLFIVVSIFIYNIPEIQISDESYIIKSAKRGGKTTVTLSDGTKVYLYPDAEIKYLEFFDENERKIHLKGRAFFDVAKDVNKPFIVEADELYVKVIGTSFLVEQDDHISKVSVKTGIVNVKHEDHEIELIQDQAVLIDSSNGIPHLERGKQEDFSWIDGELIFNDEPLSEVIQKINKWYGVEIILMNHRAKKCLFTGSFKNANLQVILLNISESMNMKITKSENKQYQLIGIGC
ncbi:FecR family protein [Belliella kenyensis]|uniref:FecR family protein n=1 Tax=Belliella kenyensis TaxID=1472724 RepID=A0ABV8EJW8_9BACT|nr:FecR domain-containing protein [Belliella kenyensis]MCH7400301.1 FecR domain-containing protein [Belliella kenyensis]MDN3604681.1 FecR domain-containing protein [Belliella kenyensis]